MKTYKVLIIDDAFFIRNLIKKAIVKKPIKNDVKFEIIGETDDIATGLDMVYDIEPDIITVDYTFTELDSTGLELAEYIKSKLPNIPVLIISANSEPDFPNKVKEIGCYFMPKPFQEIHLWTRLDTIAEELEQMQEEYEETQTISEETKSIIEKISKEVDDELDQFELEEVQLPKVANPQKPKVIDEFDEIESVYIDVSEPKKSNQKPTPIIKPIQEEVKPINVNKPTPVVKPIQQEVKPINVSKPTPVVKPIQEEVKPINVNKPTPVVKPIQQEVKPINVNKPTPVVKPIQQEVKPINVNKPTPVVKPIQQEIKPINVNKPTPVVKPIQQEVKPINVSKPTPVVKPIQQEVKPINVSKPTPVVKPIQEEVKPINVNKPTPVVKPIQQEVKPINVNKPTPVVKPIQQEVKPINVSKPTPVVKPIQQEVKPINVSKPTPVVKEEIKPNFINIEKEEVETSSDDFDYSIFENMFDDENVSDDLDNIKSEPIDNNSNFIEDISIFEENNEFIIDENKEEVIIEDEIIIEDNNEEVVIEDEFIIEDNNEEIIIDDEIVIDDNNEEVIIEDEIVIEEPKPVLPTRKLDRLSLLKETPKPVEPPQDEKLVLPTRKLDRLALLRDDNNTTKPKQTFKVEKFSLNNVNSKYNISVEKNTIEEPLTLPLEKENIVPLEKENISFDIDIVKKETSETNNIALDVEKEEIEEFIVENIEKTEMNNFEQNEDIQFLYNHLSYSYQNEMAYILNIIEQIKRPDAYIIQVEEKENKYEEQIANFKPESETTEDFESNFEKMFAEFNPGVYTVNSNVEEETRIKETEKITNSLISEGPAISSQVNIRPPQDRTVRKLYNQDEKEKELENLLNEEVETPKESVFTKIFKAFSKK